MAGFHWTCPVCGRDTTITDTYHHYDGDIFRIENAEGPHAVALHFVVCPNPKCKRFTFWVELWQVAYQSGQWQRTERVKHWRLIPPSDAKAFPDYVPQAIREDYAEACLIKNLSPKASATLARRCLQGMIRDFWKVKKRRLVDEINAIKNRVDPSTWRAIDAVRGIGNIGAHMEKDINLIVDVEPEEAAKLIELIEYLIKDWYINRHEREEAMKSIVQIGDTKKQAKTEQQSLQPQSTQS